MVERILHSQFAADKLNKNIAGCVLHKIHMAQSWALLSTPSKCLFGLFNVESPNSTRPSMSTKPSAIPDMTSSATSGRHFSKFEKRPKMPPPNSLGRILVARRFACPPIGGVLVSSSRHSQVFCFGIQNQWKACASLGANHFSTTGLQTEYLLYGAFDN